MQFAPEIQQWFDRTYPGPTDAQAQAWPLCRGRHARHRHPRRRPRRTRPPREDRLTVFGIAQSRSRPRSNEWCPTRRCANASPRRPQRGRDKVLPALAFGSAWRGLWQKIILYTL